MTVSTYQTLNRDGDEALHRFVEDSLANCRGSSSQLVRLDRKPSEYRSSFAIDILTAFFADKTRCDLIFKDLSPHGLLEGARQVRPQFAYDPSREIKVYREILPNANLGTATCFGSLVDPGQQRYWLLLEKVAGDELYTIGDFSIWCDVAQWLARAHVCLASAVRRHQNEEWLVVCDERFCNAWIERAEHFVSQGERLNIRTATPAQMNWLSDRCKGAVRQICTLPMTIIHGEFYASNVLVEKRYGQTRICPVDWETAAIGPGLIDLAALVAGSWTEPQKEKLARAYYDGHPALLKLYGDFEGLMMGLRSCRLLLAIKWLGFARDWQPPVEHRCDWLAEAMQLADTLVPIEPDM